MQIQDWNWCQVSKFQTHSILDDVASDARTDDARKCGNRVGDAHDDAGVLRCNIQLIDAETRPSESSKTDGDGQTSDGSGYGVRESRGQHEYGLGNKRATSEDFPHLRPFKDQFRLAEERRRRSLTLVVDMRHFDRSKSANCPPLDTTIDIAK